VKTFGTLASVGDQWRMDGVPAHVALKLKSIFPRIRRDQVAPFTFPDTLEHRADLNWFIKRYPMTVSATDKALLRHGALDFELKRDEIERILLPTWQPSAPAVLKGGFEFRDYQARVIDVAQRLGRLLLVDPASAGKTLELLGACMKKEFLPAAIAVEPHLRTQWAEKGVRKFTHLTPHVITSTKPYNLPKADVYILGHNALPYWADIAQSGFFRSFGVDEVQTFRGGPGPDHSPIMKYRAARVFADNAAFKMGVTASLIYNYGSETYPIVDLFAPGALGSQSEFFYEWCTGKLVKDPDALGTYLREQHILISRTEEEIGQALPKPNVIPITVDYDESVEAEQVGLARSLAMRVLDGSFEESGQAARELDMLLRKVTGLAKARHVAAYVRMLISAGEPVLLAGWHRDVYDVWLKELSDFNPVLYTGSESTKEKDAAAAEFMSGRSPLMIISLRSGAGLDGLEALCNTVVFGELDWSQGIHNQVIWRVRRWTQKRWPVNAIYCIANGGSDPAIVSTLGIKADQARGIERPGSAVENVVRDASRIKTLARMYLEQHGGA
jgi:hypothetical protein